MLEQAKETVIVPIMTSDHRFIGIKFTLGHDQVSGPGLWRHNDSLLCDSKYMKVITDCIEEVKPQSFKNGMAQWEHCKFKILKGNSNRLWQGKSQTSKEGKDNKTDRVIYASLRK